jgi:hypothetical protein
MYREKSRTLLVDKAGWIGRILTGSGIQNSAQAGRTSLLFPDFIADSMDFVIVRVRARSTMLSMPMPVSRHNDDYVMPLRSSVGLTLRTLAKVTIASSDAE